MNANTVDFKQGWLPVVLVTLLFWKLLP